MAKPSISYDDDEMQNARQIKEQEAQRMNAELRAQQLEEQQKAATTKKRVAKKEVVYEDEEDVEISASEPVAIEKVATKIEEVEEEKEVASDEPSQEVSDRVVRDASGNEIPVDETLEDPFANLDSGEAGVIAGEVDVQNPVSKNAGKNLPKKTSKEAIKAEENEDGDVVISGVVNTARRNDIIVDEEVEEVKELMQSSVPVPEAETEENIQKKSEIQLSGDAEDEYKPADALTDIHGNEKPFEQQRSTPTLDDTFNGIDMGGSLADIEVVDNSNLVDIADSTNRIFTAPVFQVTALKSAYVAYMTALTFKDRDIFNRSDVDRITHNRNLFRMVYDRLDHTSIGNISYQDFLKITAWEDLPTLLFGIYRQTFPGDSEIMLKCNHCGKESRISIDPNKFIVTKNEEATAEIQELIRDLNSRTGIKAQDVLKESQVNKLKRTRLPHSKIVIDISNPSLERFLTVAAYFNKRLEESENMPSLVSSAIFIDKIYVPNIRLSKERGKLVYDKVENLPDVLKILGRIDTEDEFRLKEKVLIRKDKYTVDYKIRNVICPVCKKTIADVDADIENLLFLATNLAVTYRTLPDKQNA
jgi:hypothetical protein